MADRIRRRVIDKVQLYFNCPGKMDRIERMCKYTNYEDMTVIISTISERDLIAKHRIKFGKGWMDRNAKIRGVDYVSGGPKGIIIFITISESVDVIDCWLESPKDSIHLGIHTDIVNNWFHTCMSWTEWMEERAEERARHAEEEEILVEARIGEMEMLEEMRVGAKIRKALYGQTDEISDMFEGLAVF